MSPSWAPRPTSRHGRTEGEATVLVLATDQGAAFLRVGASGSLRGYFARARGGGVFRAAHCQRRPHFDGCHTVMVCTVAMAGGNPPRPGLAEDG